MAVVLVVVAMPCVSALNECLTGATHTRKHT